MATHPDIQNPPGEAAAGFEEVDHTADVALRLWAPDYKSLLVQAALGTASILTGRIPSGPLPVGKHMALEAFDRESLLVTFLGELAYFAEVDREIFLKFEFECVTDRRLVVLAEGLRVPALKTVIKAVTYHDLEIVETGRGLRATIVLDV
jgi:SHS2 domain-containing protein